jgi:autotransporter-associated beta strand protein
MSHGMLQSGTFQLCARGVNWFVDLKSESYDVPNHNGTTPVAGADRWDYYRNRAEGHNCLIVNPTSQPDRIWNAPSAPLIAYESAPNGQRSFAIWDLSANITGVTKVQRGIQLLGQRKQVLVQDEIVHPTPTTCWWFAHFSASVATAISGDGSSVTLTSGSERLWGKIIGGGGVWTVRDALPLPTSPAPAENASNTSYEKLAIQLTGVTNTTLAVWFVPLAPGENPPTNSPALTSLSTWSLVASNDSPVAHDGFATSTNNAPVDVDLLGLASDDWTYPNQLLFAVTNAQDGSAVLLPDGHTARFTPAGPNPGFDYLVTDEDGQTSSASSIISVPPVTYVWTNRASGSWSAGANWSNGVAPVSSRGNRLEFFSGQTFGGGPFTLNNNLPGTTLVNALVLGGIASGTATINLTGGPLQLTANGLTKPGITLDAYTSVFTYNISNAITLADDVTIAGDHSGTFNFAGSLSGAGGVTRNGTYGTLIFSGNNSYTGPTVISAGTLQIGNDGATGTLGSGEVLNNGQLRFDRTGSVDVPNDISGSGSVLLHCPSVNDVVQLTGDNTFTGEVRMTGGSLRVTDRAQLGSGTKNIVVDSANGALRLDGAVGDIVLPASLRLFTSNPNGAIINLAGDNVIEGLVTLAAGAGGSRFSVSSGSLAINGVVTPNTSGRTLDLRGAADGFIFGNISDGPGTNVLVALTKNDAGSWTLGGSNAYAGATTVSGGSLVINGSLASPSNVTVAASARLAGSGSNAAPTAVLGLLAPGDRFGTLTMLSNLTFGSASRLQWELGSNSLASGDLLAATTVAVTNGAKVDVLLNSPGSAANFLHALWRTNRSWPVINATALSGAFTLGTNSTDAGGRLASTYGSFSVTNTGTNVSVLWTALPGFPVINDPTVTITAPAANPASFALGGAPLNLTASVNAGGGSSLGVNWTFVSEAGSATFANAAATNTTVQFSDEGEYLLRCTVTNEVGVASAELTVFVTPVPTWFETRIAFTNYSRTEPLTNFPALVVLGTNVPGFSYAQFRTPDGSDLRFFDAAGLAELNFEIETWNTNGSSFVWVQVPLFTNQCSIRARWGDPAVTDPPVGAGTGATWSEDYLGVWHLAETSGAHYDSSPALAASRFVSASQQGTATGIAGGADNFDGTNNYVSLPDMGTAPFVTVEAWVKLNGTPSGGDIGLVSSDGWSAGITHFKTSSTRNLKAQFYGGSPVVSSASVVTIGGWAHVAYTIGGVGATDLRLYLNGALLATAAGTANNVLTDVNLAREYNGRYLNARMDEVRISSVARSSNWLWATSQTIASNSVFNSYRSVVPPITIIPPNPILSSPTVVGGQFQFTMNGTPGYLHTIQASTNLTTWNDLYQWTPLTMPVVFAETNLSTFTKRFYRVIISP